MAEDFSLSLKNLKAGDEYVVCMTGTRIERALLELSFDSIPGAGKRTACLIAQET